VSALPARAAGADDMPDAGLSLTSYELSLPGRDKILGTEDDLYIRDGRITDAPRPAARPSTAPRPAARSF
jgi:hypothetical protein